MPASAGTSECYFEEVRVRFGDFILDTDQRELLRGSESVHLPPKALEALSILIERRPSAVAQTDLYDRLWPDTFVDKSNLHNVIHQLRAVLGDGDHLIIRTVYGFGFSFSAPAVDNAPRSAGWQIVIGDREFDLPEGENIVGRDHNVAVRIDSPSISRSHARIIVSSDGATIEDLGSKNGTALNGRRVRDVRPIADDDKVTFGAIAAVFRVVRTVKSTETVR